MLHTGAVLSLLLTSDDKTLFSGDDMGHLQNWNVDSKTIIREYLLENQYGICNMNWKDHDLETEILITDKYNVLLQFSTQQDIQVYKNTYVNECAMKPKKEDEIKKKNTFIHKIFNNTQKAFKQVKNNIYKVSLSSMKDSHKEQISFYRNFNSNYNFIVSMVATSDGQWLFAAENNDKFKSNLLKFNQKNGKLKKRYSNLFDSWVTNQKISIDDKVIFAANFDGSVSRFVIHKSRLVKILKNQHRKENHKGSFYINSLVINNKSTFLYCADNVGGILKYNICPDKGGNLGLNFLELTKLDNYCKKENTLVIHDFSINFICLSKDEYFLFSCDSQGIIKQSRA